MIPAYNPRADYLGQALGSVLAQDPGPDRLRIEVVDDCSTQVDVESLVRSIAGDRVGCSRTPANLGLAGCWNTCIERARGTWVHILHQDDYLSVGFYTRVEEAASAHPEVKFVATRSFILNNEGIIDKVSHRVPELENGGRSVSGFYYQNPLRFPGVVVRRDCYEECGGFRTDLIFTLDVEMWTRAISRCGGLVLPDVLAFYRFSKGNQTSKLFRSAEAFEDWAELIRMYGVRYSDIDLGRARQEMFRELLEQTEWARQAGDWEGVAAMSAFWKKNATLKLKLRRMATGLVRRASRALG
jgi:glycosyltransferase involved in cell wall biosynthesis